jgi:hypothetical protein
MQKPNRTLLKFTVPVLVLILLIGVTPALVNAAMGPSLTILSPAGPLNTSNVVNPSFVVSFAVGNFEFVSPGAEGLTNEPNKGHIHVFLDGVYLTLWARPEGIPFNNIPAGQHTIKLQLVNHDHSALSPDVSASVTVQVTAAPQGTPDLAILSPAGPLNSATNVAPSFVVSFKVDNFLPTDPIGQPKALNTGHVHVFHDGAYYGLWTSLNQLPFIGLTSGSHTIKLQLVNNDHSALSPDVSQTITVTVSAPSTAPPSPGAIPGFPIEAVLAGALIWIGALALITRKRKTKE